MTKSSQTDIPVVSLGEASLLHACSLGRRVGLVTISPAFVPWHEEQVRRHGLEQRLAGVTAIAGDLSRLTRAFDDPAEYAALRAEFVERARPLIARGADVLIPAGGLPMLLLARERPLAFDGVLVLDGIATVLKAAEMAVAMHRLTAAAARTGIYRKAPDGAAADYLASRSP